MTSVFSDFYDKTVIIAEYEIDDYTGKTEKTVLSEIKADVQRTAVAEQESNTVWI